MSDFKNNQCVLELVNKLRERRVIPFVGAGVSATAGLPSWDGLVERVSNALQIDRNMIREKRDLLVAIEYLMLKGRDIIPSILADILERSQNVPEPSDLIMNIARLEVPAIYTTNWDDLLEEAYRRLNRTFTSIAQPADLTRISLGATPIVKYHGSIKYPTTMVISESQYYERFGIDSPFDLRLRADMMEYHFLFLGYSLRDYNIRYIWNRTQRLFRDIDGAQPPCAYFVATHPDDVFYTVLRANNIRVIELTNRDEFPSFVQYISQAGVPKSNIT